jgi:hypothetical protein
LSNSCVSRVANCPSNASGAPSCVCNRGYSGTLYWNTSTNSWNGSCSTFGGGDGDEEIEEHK